MKLIRWYQMRRVWASEVIGVDVDLSGRNNLTSSMIMTGGLLEVFWVSPQWTISAMDLLSIVRTAVWIHLYWLLARYSRAGCQALTQQGKSSWMRMSDTADNHSLVFDWSRVRRSAADKVLMMLEMNILSYDWLLLEDAGLFIADRNGGAFVRGKALIT